jgi:RNase P subunit RPR2
MPIQIKICPSCHVSQLRIRTDRAEWGQKWLWCQTCGYMHRVSDHTNSVTKESDHAAEEWVRK